MSPLPLAALLGGMLSAGPPPMGPAPTGPAPADAWTVHNPEALQAALTQACTRATAADKPVLLGFSAPWCLDCQVLHKLEVEPTVAAELASWERVVTDVGRFERHQPLLRALGGDRIAWWVALKPTADQCSASPTTWPRLRSGGIEPATGQQVQTAADLVQWLVEARSS